MCSMCLCGPVGARGEAYHRTKRRFTISRDEKKKKGGGEGHKKLAVWNSPTSKKKEPKSFGNLLT